MRSLDAIEVEPGIGPAEGGVTVGGPIESLKGTRQVAAEHLRGRSVVQDLGGLELLAEGIEEPLGEPGVLLGVVDQAKRDADDDPVVQCAPPTAGPQGAAAHDGLGEIGACLSFPADQGQDVRGAAVAGAGPPAGSAPWPRRTDAGPRCGPHASTTPRVAMTSACRSRLTPRARRSAANPCRSDSSVRPASRWTIAAAWWARQERRRIPGRVDYLHCSCESRLRPRYCEGEATRQDRRQRRTRIHEAAPPLVYLRAPSVTPASQTTSFAGLESAAGRHAPVTTHDGSSLASNQPTLPPWWQDVPNLASGPPPCSSTESLKASRARLETSPEPRHRVAHWRRGRLPVPARGCPRARS